MIEDGVIEGEKWADGGGTYTPSIFSKVYKLTFKSFATPLIKDLIKLYTFGYEMESLRNRTHTDFDQLITYEQDGRKLLFASKGEVVMVIAYFGDVEIERIIEKVVEKINEM